MTERTPPNEKRAWLEAATLLEPRVEWPKDAPPMPVEMRRVIIASILRARVRAKGAQ